VLRNYYEILEILPYASSIEIKKAYRRLAFRYHPDLNPDKPLSEEQFKEISQAYEVLKDRQKRLNYDFVIKKNKTEEKRRRTVNRNNSRKNFNDFLNEFWERFYKRSYTKHINKPIKGKNIRLNLKLSREKATIGGETKIEVPYYFLCPKCGKNKVPVGIQRNCQICMGKGEIIIPKKLFIEIPFGAATGTRIIVKEQGKPSRNGGRAGDLYIVLHILPS
jgi:molecular chaperone DnaJ